MKRFSLLCVLAILCSLPAYSQFWISFGWNEPHCQNCLWMEQAMHLPARQAAEYHKIIHKYGQKIEKEARRDYRYWDRAARRIYDLRMETYIDSSPVQSICPFCKGASATYP